MKFQNHRYAITVTSILLGLLFCGSVTATPARDSIIKSFAAQAGTPFSAQGGKTLFESRQGGGKPKTPSCTSCHGTNPATIGKTRAGKPIKPMAVSKTSSRYTDPKKVAKWFRRNCKTVLGRECTAREKGDFLTFMISR